MKTKIITNEEYLAVKEIAKQNTNKRVDKRLQAIILRYEGMTDAKIGEKLGYHRMSISKLCADFKKLGVQEYARHKYGGNNQALSTEEEHKILESFEDKAARGEIICVNDIKAAIDEIRGKDTGNSYIYLLLSRHRWRKVMPRSRHPQKASEEAIEASKKLTTVTTQ